jgi:hypothetical protein
VRPDSEMCLVLPDQFRPDWISPFCFHCHDHLPSTKAGPGATAIWLSLLEITV